MFLEKKSNISILNYLHSIKLVKQNIECCFDKQNPEIIKALIIFDLIYELLCFKNPLETEEFQKFEYELEHLEIYDSVNKQLMGNNY